MSSCWTSCCSFPASVQLLLLELHRQLLDTEERELTSDAHMNLDMNHIQSIFVKGSVTSWINKNIMVKSGSPAKDERFSLTDDTTARVFTVTITDLRTEDEGQYWCVVRRTVPLPDLYSEILLLVKLNKNTTEVSTISPSSKTPSSFSPTELNPQSGQFLCLSLFMTLISSILCF
ncbi:hypothetical protein PO909_016194 [Leuciscus waleckii]